MLVEGTWLIGNSLRVERVGDRTIVMTSGIVVFHDWLIQMMRAEREDRKEGFDLDLNPYINNCPSLELKLRRGRRTPSNIWCRCF